LSPIAEIGGGVGERLARGGERFAVHVFVEKGEQEIVDGLVLDLGQQGQHAVEDVGGVAQGVGARGQGQVPARLVGDGRGVVEGVGVGAEGRLAFAAQGPLFLKPGEVADLPEEGLTVGR